MATGKKNAAAAKKAQPGKKTAAKASAAKTAAAKPEENFTREVILWIIVAISLLLFLSNFGLGGTIGNAVSSFFFGVFGLIAYVFPPVLLVGTFFAVSNRGNRIAVVKLVAMALLVIFLCMFAELIVHGNEPLTGPDAYLYSHEHKTGGGFAGGLLAQLISSCFGLIGAYVIDAVVLIISLVLLTERSALRGMQKGGKKVYESAKIGNQKYRERAGQRREEREQKRELKREEMAQRRMDRKVQGVAIDTRVVPKQEPGGISELYAEYPQEEPAFYDGAGVSPAGGIGAGTGMAAVGGGMYEIAADAFSLEEERQVSLSPVGPSPEREIKLSALTEHTAGVPRMPYIASESEVELAPMTVKQEEPESAIELIPTEREEKTGAHRDRPSIQTEPQEEQMQESADWQRPFDETASEQIAADVRGILAERMDEPAFAEDADAWQETAAGAEDADAWQETAWNAREETHDEPAFAEDADAWQETAAGAEDADAWQETAWNAREETHDEPAFAEDADAWQETAAVREAREQETVRKTAEDTFAEPAARPATGIHTGSASVRQQEPARPVEITPEEPPQKPYVFPPVTLLNEVKQTAGESKQQLQMTALKLQQTLKNFGVSVTITNISCGPAVTRYEIQPEMGVRVNKIVNLADDIKLNLAAADIRIEAPIPGKAAVGIEVPNKENSMVAFRELIESEEFQKHDSRISFCVGKDIAGKPTVADIAKMPHLLIAGATGSGKSVCINTIVMSILYKADPKDVKLIMVDPKVVELSIYNGIPHLMIPVVTDPKKAAGALQWAVVEMDERYQKFAEAGVRDLKGYNAKIDSLPTIEGDPKPEKLPQIVIIVDELADLMMVAAGEVEESICRLAQLARACGIHLIIATQRPSVNVITGLIKANMPSRIAFAVTSGTDSRTILDMVGAEKLLGKGDMLFHPQGIPKPVRVQGAFVSDTEVTNVVEFLKEQNGQVTYRPDMEAKMSSLGAAGSGVGMDAGGGDGRDSYFADAARLIIDKDKASIGMLQRYFKVGFNRAARIMDQLEEAGIVGPEEGTKPRRVLMSPEQFEQYEEDYL